MLVSRRVNYWWRLCFFIGWTANSYKHCLVHVGQHRSTVRTITTTTSSRYYSSRYITNGCNTVYSSPFCGSSGSGGCVVVSSHSGRLYATTTTSTSLRTSSSLDDDEILSLINQRTNYRQLKIFDEADRIRNQLAQSGIEIIDRIGWKTDYYKRITTTTLNTSDGDALDISATSAPAHHRFMKIVDLITQQSITPTTTTLGSSSMEQQHSSSSYLDLLDTAKIILTQQRYGQSHDGHLIENQILSQKTQLSEEMQGRKYADAAFSLALAGVTDNELFELLANSTMIELTRFGIRQSCKPFLIFQIMEKLAIAGIRRNHPVFKLGADLVLQKNAISNISIDKNLLGEDSQQEEVIKERWLLTSRRPLLWLWRKSSKYDKSGLQMEQETSSDISDKTTTDIHTATFTMTQQFVNRQLPLVVDLGCGYGTMSLALTIMQGDQKRFNCLGVDMSHRSLCYPRGIASRWNLTDHCCFVRMNVDDAIEQLHDSYPGPVALALINFPTPFKSPLRDPNAAGNSQLPNLSQFLVRPEMLASLYDLGKKRTAAESSLLLLVQSNVEDVILQVRDSLIQSGLWEIPTLHMISHTLEKSLQIKQTELQELSWRTIDQLESFPPSQRDSLWRESVGIDPLRRAAGEGFLHGNPLPIRCQSETEAVYEVEGRAVHRLIVIARNENLKT